jgi:hypothetical protein
MAPAEPAPTITVSYVNKLALLGIYTVGGYKLPTNLDFHLGRYSLD